MVPNFLYSNSYHFFNIINDSIIIIIIIVIITFFYCLLISHWVAKLPSQLFFNISK